MAGFIRRYSDFVGAEIITQIEGVVIIDLPPPGAINGVSTGTVALVGEFPDMTYALDVDPTGAVLSKPRAVDITSGQDLIDKVGGFDDTIGQFGGDLGNGFVELRNKKFARLVVVPINMASATGIRIWRKLATNVSATSAVPVVAVAGGVINAGREFKLANGLDRLRVAKRVIFSDAPAYASDIDGAITNSGTPAATQTFTSAGGLFATRGVKEGDALVLGVIGGAGPLGANADTYRVVSVTSETVLVVQKQNGANFDWTTGTAQPWRLHVAAVADTGADHQLSEAAGYTIPVRPLTDGQGTGSDAADGTWAASAALSPIVAPPALAADSADPLSGLAAAVTPTGGVVFVAALQKKNAPNSATIESAYSAALTALLDASEPARSVSHVWAARKSSNIRSLLRTHALNASSSGRGRTVGVAPEVDTLVAATVLGSAAPGVGATRAERVFYSWPGVLTFVPEAAGIKLATADGRTTEDGVLDGTSDGWLAAILSNLPPERNPGEGTRTVQSVMSPVLGLQRGVPTLTMNDYILFRQGGIAAPRVDRAVGTIFQSGITSSITSGEKNINRRRMADFIQDSWAERMVGLSKLPLTEQLKGTILTETDDFMQELLSPDNPPAQRISGYQVDGKSGNTAALEAKGIFVTILRVRTLATADFIVLQTEIGEGVVLVSEVSAA